MTGALITGRIKDLILVGIAIGIFFVLDVSLKSCSYVNSELSLDRLLPNYGDEPAVLTAPLRHFDSYLILSIDRFSL